MINTYTKTQIKKAAKVLRDKNLFNPQEIADAENKLTFWRTLHSQPLNLLNEYINKNLPVDFKALRSKRIKRSISIINKLKRENSTNLTTMQDIAGYRVILPTVNQVHELSNILKSKKDTTFQIQENLCKDYINPPKESGYRGIHLVYKYFSQENPIDGLLLELQIRTHIQHIWATAVETMGIFKNFSLKSNEGPQEWLDFFKLSSAAFAIYENSQKSLSFEKIPNLKIITNTIEQFKILEVEKYLKGITVAIQHIENKYQNPSSYNLVVLNLDKRIVNVKNFDLDKMDIANQAYTECERRIEQGENLHAVLVSTSSLQELKEAYPSYFGDSNEFIKKIEKLENMIPDLY